MSSREMWNQMDRDLKQSLSRYRACRQARPSVATGSMASYTSPGSVNLPWCAYALGYYTKTFIYWFECSMMEPYNDEAVGNLRHSLHASDQALTQLGDVLRSGSPPRITRKLDRFSELLFPRDTETFEHSFFVSRVPGRQLWAGLAKLVEHSLDGAGELATWLQLGLEVGRYRVAVDTAGFGRPGFTVELNRWPETHSLIDKAVNLPGTALRRFPLLDSLIELASRQTSRTEPSLLLRNFIEANRPILPFWTDFIDFMTVTLVVHALDAEIREVLARNLSESEMRESIRSAIAPVWDRGDPWHREKKGRGELRLQGQLLRTVRFDAEPIRLVLNRFDNLLRVRLMASH